MTDPLRDLLGVLWGFVPARVLTCAHAEGFFDLFGQNGERTISVIDIGNLIQWAPRPTEIALGILAQLELVTWDKDSEWIALTEKGKKWFSSGSDHNLGRYLHRLNKLMEAYGSLETVLRNDAPSNVMESETIAAFGGNEIATKDFLLTMNAAALEFAPDLASALAAELRTNERLMILDVGCGLGAISIVLSEVFPLATIEAFDLPGVAKLAGKLVAARSKATQVKISPGNWRSRAWSEQVYDSVILSQVLHEVPQAEAEDLFSKATTALKRGGLLAVVIVGDATVPGGDSIHRLFSMNMLVETGGDNPTEAWLRKMEGLLPLERYCFHRMRGGRTLWVGRKIG